jgi:hypothetical protein
MYYIVDYFLESNVHHFRQESPAASHENRPSLI